MWLECSGVTRFYLDEIFLQIKDDDLRREDIDIAASAFPNRSEQKPQGSSRWRSPLSPAHPCMH